MLAGVLLAGVGTLLPWLTADFIDFGDLPNGFETYYFFDDVDPITWTNPGAYVLGAMLLVAIMAIVALAARKTTATVVLAIAATLLAGFVSFLALVVVADLVSNNSGIGLNFGPGIALVALGSIVSFVGSILVAIKRSTSLPDRQARL